MNIFMIKTGPLAVNTYIVSNEGDTHCCVIDPGDEANKIDLVLKNNNLSLKAILLTHGHYDHIGAVSFFREKYLCPIYVHKSEVEMLESPEKNLSASFGVQPIVIEKPENLLSDKDCFCVAGLDFSVIHTPGHSKGSVVYRCGNVLFTGDTLFRGGCGRCDLWGGSVQEMRASLDKLFEEPENLVAYPGHNAPTTLDKEREHYKFFI